MIRPRPALWFEILAARDDAACVLEAIAGTGSVELEPRSAATSARALAGLDPGLARFAELAARYRAYWPKPAVHGSVVGEAPAATLERALARLDEWSVAAEPLVRELQAIAAERAELAVWERVLADLGGAPIDFAQLGAPGPVLRKRLVVFPAHAVVDLPPGLIAREIDHDKIRAVLVVGTDAELAALEQQAAAVHGRAYGAPAWLRQSASESLAYVPARMHALERDEARASAALEQLEARHGLPEVLADVHRLEWLARNVGPLETTPLFCWITGWTSDLTGHRLATAIDRCGARALLHFPHAQPGREAPLLLQNPWWARPFEIFSRALGMPSRNEADPAIVLALAVPLMFGYMFGDVGQGLVLAAGAFALRRRFAVARLLVAGGLAAACFGILFGSAFSLHLVPALWLQPLANPLPVLLAPLAGGAVLLCIGVLFGAAEAHWRGELRHWLMTDSWLLVAYAATLASPWRPELLAGAIAAGALYGVGAGLDSRDVAGGLAGLAEFVERMVQLLINTLSFARVGAFALAHAGLSSAIVALMDATDSALARALLLVLGNAIVLGLETMVVSIQTTRLVLFEFFTRFLAAQGRVFRPLPLPPSTVVLQEP